EDLPANSQVDENGIPTIAALQAAIPKTKEEIESAHSIIRKGYVDVATTYIVDLAENEKGIAALDTLDKKYPKHEHQAEVLYLRYQAAVALGDLDKATQM